MSEERTPLAAKGGLTLAGTAYELHSARLCDDGIVYTATAADAAAWEDVLIRELYPRRAALSRLEDGALLARPAGLDALRRARETAELGQRAEDAWLRPCGGRSRLIDAHGTSYVVRSFPRAVPLRALLGRGPAPVDTALALTEQLLREVEDIHRAGLLHLHICPEKLCLGPDGGLILDYDFLYRRQRVGEYSGLARQTRYESPELRLGNAGELCAASDVYSVSAVLFELLSGRPLAESEILGSGPRAALRRLLPVRDSERSPGLTELLCRGLHHLPHRRFASAEEFLEALQSLNYKRPQ